MRPLQIRDRWYYITHNSQVWTSSVLDDAYLPYGSVTFVRTLITGGPGLNEISPVQWRLP